MNQIFSFYHHAIYLHLYIRLFFPLPPVSSPSSILSHLHFLLLLLPGLLNLSFSRNSIRLTPQNTAHEALLAPHRSSPDRVLTAPCRYLYTCEPFTQRTCGKDVQAESYQLWRQFIKMLFWPSRRDTRSREVGDASTIFPLI